MTEVRITDLTKAFGAVRAVDELSLTIGNGEFVSLLGPSGCGKTTTLKLIAGFEDADHGEIRFDGRDVAKLPAEKRDIGMVFQNYALFPHMTVVKNLAFGLEMRAVAKAEMAERIARVLDMVQLTGYEERYPRQLSGGQQQRVALARALVIEPQILLLDEPLANLDAKLREEMRVFIRDIQKRVGITTVYVTHDQAEAMMMSDRVVVMFGGRIAQLGAPAEIYEQPRTLEVAGFVGQVNLIDAEVISSSGNEHRLRSGLGEVTVASPRRLEAGARATLGLRPESIRLSPDSGADGWAGTIDGRYYTGNLVEYRVALAGGLSLQVQALAATQFAPGQAVTVTVPPDRFLVFEPQAA